MGDTYDASEWAPNWTPDTWTDTGRLLPDGTTIYGGTNETSGGNNGWNGVWASLIGNAGNYLIAKDAKANGLQYGVAPNGAPVYKPAGLTLPAITGNGGGLLLIGAAVVAAVLIAKG